MFRKLVFINFHLSLFFLFGNFFINGQHNSLSRPGGFSEYIFQRCWVIPEDLNSQIASDNENTLFISLSDGTIKALDLKGDEIWKTNLGGEIVSPLQYQNDKIFVISQTSMLLQETDIKDRTNTFTISALDKESGISIWKKEYRSMQIPKLSAFKDRLLIVTSEKSTNGIVSIINFVEENFGKSLFHKGYNFEVLQIFNARDENRQNIMLLTSLQTIASISLFEGETTFSKTVTDYVQAGTYFNRGVLLADKRGNINFVDSSGAEQQFKIKFGAGISSVTHYKNSILVTSLDNFFYSLAEDGRRLNWKRRFAGRITEKPIIREDAIFAYSQGDSVLYILNHGDGRVLNRVSVTNKKEINGFPVLLKNFLFIMTNGGLEAFSSREC